MITEEQLRLIHEKYHSGQDFQEIFWLYEKIEDINPHVIVEIGVYAGGTLLFLSNLCKRPDDLVIGLDCDWNKWKEYGWDISLPTPKVILIDGDSHLPKTINRLKEVLNNRPIDFIFIDGDHSEKGITLDYEIYAPMVRDGGIIAFHDLNMGVDPRENKPEEGKVKGFWDKLTHKKYSFYADPLADGIHGTGYIIKGEKEG